MNIRMLGPSNVQYQAMVANGRNYSAGAGQPLDVIDCDAAILNANGWTWVAPSGPTSARPTGTLGLYAARQGQQFYDTSLGILIEYAGGAWRNPATGAAV